MFASIIDDQIKLLKTRGESDGGDLRLLADLAEKEGDECRQRGPRAALAAAVFRYRVRE